MDQKDVHAQIDDLRSDIAGLAQKIAGYVERDSAALGEAVSRGARYARRAVDKQFATAAAQGADMADAARARTNDLQDAVEAYVSENPIRSIAIAAGIGLLLGAMSRR
ncbi:MAG: DUF883 family protein [Rhizobiales bacterium]|nr:DUF883 family protein [Hyphomicrobiales bacterium]